VQFYIVKLKHNDMKTIVFGATGTIGKHLVLQLLASGHTVTAFTRHPEKIQISNSNLIFKKGDVLDPASVDEAVAGQDVIFCTLGDGNKGITRAAGTKSIVRAMRKHGVRRLIVQTTLGLGESAGNLNFFWKRVMFGFLIKKAFKDHELQEGIVKTSELDYTIVRPSAFTDVVPDGQYKIGFNGAVKDLALKISRADVAKFMIEQIGTQQWLRKAVSISN
jgi:putative NADH-flavin reductase